MKIYDAKNPKYEALVTGELDLEFHSYATKIMMTKVHLAISFDPSPQNIESACIELRDYFMSNQHGAKQDLKLIFGEGAAL